MIRRPMRDYDETWRSFRWELPATFNFGADVVDRWAEDPQRPALIWCDGAGRERRFTFAEIARLSDRFANLLRAGGIGKGDRVIVMLPRIPEWQIAMVGCLKAGAVAIPCITMLTGHDIAYRIAHSGAVGAVTTRDNLGKFDAEAPLRLRLSVGGGEGWLDFDAALAGQPDRFAPAAVGIEDPAILYYTSGSTGQPKGVTHAARSLFAWRVSAWYWLTLTERDLMWCTADTGWSKAGTSILFGPWSCGAAVLFYDGPFEPRRRFELIERYGVTVFCAAATELRRLILEDISGFDLSRLRLAVSAGETVNPEVVERWRALTGVPLLDGYGQTETLMTVLNYPPMPVKPGSMGKPLPGTEIAVLDEADRPVGPGEVGRLVIRTPHPQLMLGYWQAPELTRAGFVRSGGAEWFVTGDAVHVDADGYVFYHGRTDDVINSAGYRIGPMEVENALMEHPAVQECAVVGSPDPERGEVVRAYIVLHEGMRASEALAKDIQDHVKRITAPYKYPRQVTFVEELPKTASGKIRRRLLRDSAYSGKPWTA